MCVDVHTLHTVENYIPFTVTLPRDINRNGFASYISSMKLTQTGLQRENPRIQFYDPNET